MRGARHIEADALERRGWLGGIRGTWGALQREEVVVGGVQVRALYQVLRGVEEGRPHYDDRAPWLRGGAPD